MMNFLKVVAVSTAALVGFTADPVALVRGELAVSQAVACEVNCVTKSPQGDLVTKGTIKKKLEYWVTVCYPAPYWDSLEARAGQAFYVSLNVVGEKGVRKGMSRFRSYEDMADAKLIERQCYTQNYQPGWVIMTITDCRTDGEAYTFLSTRTLTAADNGKTVYFEDRIDLDQYSYLVR